MTLTKNNTKQKNTPPRSNLPLKMLLKLHHEELPWQISRSSSDYKHPNDTTLGSTLMVWSTSSLLWFGPNQRKPLYIRASAHFHRIITQLLLSPVFLSYLCVDVHFVYFEAEDQVCPLEVPLDCMFTSTTCSEWLRYNKPLPFNILYLYTIMLLPPTSL